MFNRILVPLDGSPLAECVLPHVAIFARAFSAHVTLLHVVECNTTKSGTTPIDPIEWRVRKAEAQAYLSKQMEHLGEADVAADTKLLEGQPAQRIIEYVREEGSDLIIMSSHGGNGVSMWNVGSLVHKIIERVHISTLLVRAYNPPNDDVLAHHYKSILAPLDGSPRAECVLRPGSRLAEFQNAQFTLAHVIAKPCVFQHMPADQEYLDIAQRLMEYNRRQAADYLEQLQSRMAGNIATRVVRSDDVAVGLHELINDEETDLVVLSAHGNSGKAQWPYGSVTTNLLAYSDAPVLMVQDLCADQIALSAAERFVMERTGH